MTFHSSYLPRGQLTGSIPSHEQSPLHQEQQARLSSSAKRKLGSKVGLEVKESKTEGTGGESVVLATLFFFAEFFYEQAFKGGGNKLSTGTRIYSHVGVYFQHHVLVFIEEEDAERRHLLWDTAWLGDAGDDAHRPHYALDGGMVGGLQSLKQKDNKVNKCHIMLYG